MGIVSKTPCAPAAFPRKRQRIVGVAFIYSPGDNSTSGAAVSVCQCPHLPVFRHFPFRVQALFPFHDLYPIQLFTHGLIAAPIEATGVDRHHVAQQLLIPQPQERLLPDHVMFDFRH